ncbi:hypothetical protein D3C86_1804360 [compost metagenome]
MEIVADIAVQGHWHQIRLVFGNAVHVGLIAGQIRWSRKIIFLTQILTVYKTVGHVFFIGCWNRVDFAVHLHILPH